RRDLAGLPARGVVDVIPGDALLVGEAQLVADCVVGERLGEAFAVDARHHASGGVVVERVDLLARVGLESRRDLRGRGRVTDDDGLRVLDGLLNATGGVVLRFFHVVAGIDRVHRAVRGVVDGAAHAVVHAGDERGGD